ncbi:MAG: Ig domain-containing protein [Firmicutes bacterium]|nr:Ig domain-containing protein [Bacillota bacterium]
MKNFLTKAFVCAGVLASALALSSVAVFASTTYTYTFGKSGSSDDYFVPTIKRNQDGYAQISAGSGTSGGITFTTTTENAKLSIKVLGDGSKSLPFYYYIEEESTKLGDTDEKGKTGTPSEWKDITLSKAGEYRIYHTGGTARYYYISVTEDKEAGATVDATGISLDKSTDSVYVGKTTTLKATKQPANATSGVSWTSSDEEVATVSGGVVTGVSAGKATITATLDDFTATCEVTVKAIPVVTASNENGSASSLVAATETKTYDLLGAVTAIGGIDQTYPFVSDKLYFNDEILVANAGSGSGLYYQTGKATKRVDGTSETAGVRVKAGQDVIGVKLAPNSSLNVNVSSGGGSERTVFLASTASATATDLNVSETLNGVGTVGELEYTNTDSTEKIVYIIASADSFIADLKVTVPESSTTKVSTSLKPISGLVAEDGITATAKYAKVGDDHYFVLDFVEDDTLKSLDKLQYSVPTGGEFVKIYSPSLEITQLYSKVVFNEAGDDYIEESGHCYYAYKFTDADNTYTTLDAKIGSGTSSGQAR